MRAINYYLWRGFYLNLNLLLEPKSKREVVEEVVPEEVEVHQGVEEDEEVQEAEAEAGAASRHEEEEDRVADEAAASAEVPREADHPSEVVAGAVEEEEDIKQACCFYLYSLSRGWKQRRGVKYCLLQRHFPGELPTKELLSFSTIILRLASPSCIN